LPDSPASPGAGPRLRLRPVTDADAEQLIALIGSVYAEYPGCVLDLAGVDDDLPAPGRVAARRGSPWWVLEDEDTAGARRVVASVGAGPLGEDGAVELKRLYVAASHRRRGLAADLVEVVERHASAVGATRIVLWSDTRFRDAHRLYARLGYRDTGERRQLHDPSDTTEIRFEKGLDARSAEAGGAGGL